MCLYIQLLECIASEGNPNACVRICTGFHYTCIIYSVSQVAALLPTTHAQTMKSDKAMQLITEAAMEKLKAHVDTVEAVIIFVSKANKRDGPNPND